MSQHYARIVDGVVVEIWVSPSAEVTPAQAFHPDFPGTWQGCNADVVPGYLHDGAVFLPPSAAEHQPIPLVPLTRRQLRLTLLAHNLLDQVEPIIAALPEPDRSVAMIEWQDASEYRRDHALIARLGAALSLDASAIDELWLEAMGR